MADEGRRVLTPEEQEAEWENRRPGKNTWGYKITGRPKLPGSGRKRSYQSRLRDVWLAESPHIETAFAELRRRGMEGDTAALVAWLQWIVGKPRSALRVELDRGRWGASGATTATDVRAAAIAALGEDVAEIAARAQDGDLDDEEHARLVAVARATAPTRAEDADPLAGKTDDEVLAEARRLLQAPGAEQREPVEVSEVGERPADREGGAGLDREGAGGAQAGDP